MTRSFNIMQAGQQYRLNFNIRQIRFRLALLFSTILIISSFVNLDVFSQSTNEITYSVKVEILKVIQYTNPDDNSPLAGQGDYFGEVKVGNRANLQGPYVDGNKDKIFTPPYTITPSNWVFQVPGFGTSNTQNGVVPILITIGDKESPDIGGGSDDTMDINPDPNKWGIDLMYNIYTQTWTGDVPNPVAGTIVQTGGPIDGTHNRDGSAAIEFKISSFIDSDIDSDGIPDPVELGNYPFRDANGVISNFQTLGADPCRKTIAVEIDFMEVPGAGGHNHNLTTNAKQMLETMFDNADGIQNVVPCPYPGYTKTGGVNLVLDISQDPIVDNMGNPLPENPAISFGSAGNDFDQIKNDNFGANKKPYFHYALFAHRYLDSSGMVTSSSGIAEGGSHTFPLYNTGNDLVVSLGASWTNFEQASTFAHELGHNLGLDHGGNEGVNCKPNYFSIMNYNYQLLGILNGPFNPMTPVVGVMDYSDRDMPAQTPILNEKDLNENVGAQDIFSSPYFSVWKDASNMDQSGPAFGALDWNGNNNPTENNVDVDLNHFLETIVPGTYDPDDDKCRIASPDQQYSGYDDWANLQYLFQQGVNYNDGIAREHLPTEMTGQDAKEIRESIYETFTNPDLYVSQNVNLIDAIPGDTLTYTVDIKNIGKGRAVEVSIENTLPNQTIVKRDLGFIQPNQTKTEIFTFKIPFPIQDNTILTNKVVVSDIGVHGQNDDNLNDNVNSIQTVVHTPDLQISKVSQDKVKNGEAIIYKINYQNTGSGNANDVIIYDTLQKGVFYNKALDLGAGPKPIIVKSNSNGTTTLIWNIPIVPAHSSSNTIEFTARPSLLSDDKTVTNKVVIDYSDTNKNNYAAKEIMAKTGISEINPIKNPKNIVYWQAHKELWTKETLAKIQATDQRFDSTRDGILSSSEVDSTLKSFYSGKTSEMLKAQLLTTYLNMATYRITDDTRVYSPLTSLLKINNVGDAINYSILSLNSPGSSKYSQYYALTILYQINSNLIEVYTTESNYSFPLFRFQ